jgi:hypothetical protein
MRRLALAGLVLLAGCGAAPAPQVPAAPGAATGTRPPAGASGSAGGSIDLNSPSGLNGPDGPSGPTGPSVERVAVRTGDRLEISSLGISARIRRVGFSGDRLQIPASPAEIGIWRDGARPGDAVGHTVLVGHVSDNRDRPGVLARISRLRPGAAIRVWIGGRVHRFRMLQVRSYAKSGLPRSVFSQAGPQRLVLITCSHKVTYPDGRFHYEKNLVVTARPG